MTRFIPDTRFILTWNSCFSGVVKSRPLLAGARVRALETPHPLQKWKRPLPLDSGRFLATQPGLPTRPNTKLKISADGASAHQESCARPGEIGEEQTNVQQPEPEQHQRQNRPPGGTRLNRLANTQPRRCCNTCRFGFNVPGIHKSSGFKNRGHNQQTGQFRLSLACQSDNNGCLRPAAPSPPLHGCRSTDSDAPDT